MASNKGKYDRTRTQRSKNHHDRVVEAGGKRVSVDMDPDRLKKLKRLQDLGYGGTKADIIRRAIDDVDRRFGPDESDSA